jgi:hypothetical protein
MSFQIVTKFFQTNDGSLCKVIREIPHHCVTRKDGTIISELFNGWKDFLGADKVLKSDTHFMYCQNVQDVEWEDIPNENTN